MAGGQRKRKDVEKERNIIKKYKEAKSVKKLNKK